MKAPKKYYIRLSIVPRNDSYLLNVWTHQRKKYKVNIGYYNILRKHSIIHNTNL